MSPAKKPHGGTKTLSLAGAVLAAMAASACCIGPLLLALLGVGGAGALATLGAYRPYLLVLTVALLAWGFYLTYRRPRRAVVTAALGDGDACGCARPKAGLAGRIGLWIATVLVVVFATAPSVLARIAERGGSAVALAGDATLETAILHVQGIDCEACAAPLRRALTKVGGLRDLTLDVPAQNARLTYEPAPGRLQAYVVAIDDLGYEASLLLEPGRRDGDPTATKAP